MSVVEDHWQLTRPTIRERSAFLLNNDLLSDVKFCVRVSDGGSESKMIIPAHKLLLSMSSPVFLAMFYGELAETSDSIDLPDCAYESLLELFRYMYSDEVKLSGSNVMQILYLAKKYIVPSLAAKCSDYLQKNLDASNVFTILPQVQKFEEKDLADRCWTVIEERTDEALKSDEFVTLERCLVESVVKRDRLNVKEVDLFKAVDLWATRESERRGLTTDGDSKRRVLGEDILNAVRFPLMSQKEFASVVPDSDLLTAKEMGGIIKHFNDVFTSPLQFALAPRVCVIKDLQRCRRFGKCCPYQDKINRWNYDRGRPDRITFFVNKAIDLLGVRLFGSKGNEYKVALELKNSSSVLVKKSGSHFCEEDETDGHYGFDVLFDRPVSLQTGTIYTVQASIEGPISWYGEEGKETGECSSVIFSFSTSANPANDTNGTNQGKGQFPDFLFRPSL